MITLFLVISGLLLIIIGLSNKARKEPPVPIAVFGVRPTPSRFAALPLGIIFISIGVFMIIYPINALISYMIIALSVLIATIVYWPHIKK
ncbi:MAG: hypothetical protein A3A80_02825 [Candidatus Terrybacteria bacterium RIFCSPLOWO2_01_FULL_44_24]|uniref:Uncharacterized protein n=1 Tax=Candidatus Terrybacteria bacterium RIFCSPHIGHO2_01_FULL_43_35 TaxID=1802361 RepID=A0A1G2PEJ7_9BACT|nr:MAG: hypothetical protein A2828_02615 [Candidatus Terrybacteria bacterium RIFCSPHIGHO2_01_FULL_43_35]OHA50247.1 MAG: hypothetical protein A3B75_00385 [Candidatus Terrybacteria bacterium RIFCSPHIGHO2_02_FULL_43_14]OHA51002.1 MAG: hypothetical protein A3A80_02825 [Candidatus Terrybacteria bacterium RIFCSPLOWO2_01_FULL_44_24]